MKKIDTEEFMRRARKKHGDKFDYSKSVYVNYKTKLIIICKNHGEFLKTPGHHLRGQGCKECTNKKTGRLNTKEFIKKAIIKHGDKYDYSLVNYKNNGTNIKIICHNHGIFEQTPANHLRGTRCPRCLRVLNKTDFVKKANEIHNYKYNYNKASYKNSKIKITIVCDIHGDFKKSPNSHLNGQGCPKCGHIEGTEKRKIGKSEFIKRSKRIHNDKYTYVKVKYIDNNTNVIITCPTHGDFKQSPANHLSKHGCKKCADNKTSKTKRLTAGEFIKRSNIIHNNKYDYSFVVYVNSLTKVKIICPIHGAFKQAPIVHIFHKGGCQKCSYPGVFSRGLTPYKTFYKKLSEVGVECRRDPNDKDILQARCHLCKKFFSPKHEDSRSKIRVSSKINKGSANLYCCDSHKQACPVFYHNSNNIDPRSKLYIKKTSQQKTRKCQTDNLKKIQCDEYGYNYCEKCGDIIDIELHHTLEIAKYGKEAINSSGHILLCTGCHTDLHRKC